MQSYSYTCLLIELKRFILLGSWLRLTISQSHLLCTKVMWETVKRMPEKMREHWEQTFTAFGGLPTNVAGQE